MEASTINDIGLFFTFIAGLLFVKTTLLSNTVIRQLAITVVGCNNSQIEYLTQQRTYNIIGIIVLFIGLICQLI